MRVVVVVRMRMIVRMVVVVRVGVIMRMVMVMVVAVATGRAVRVAATAYRAHHATSISRTRLASPDVACIRQPLQSGRGKSVRDISCNPCASAGPGTRTTPAAPPSRRRQCANPSGNMDEWPAGWKLECSGAARRKAQGAKWAGASETCFPSVDAIATPGQEAA